MKKLFFTAICAMAFSNGFASKDVKEVIEEQVAFLGDPDFCFEGVFGPGNTVSNDFKELLDLYVTCLEGDTLDEIVIDVPKKPVISQQP